MTRGAGFACLAAALVVLTAGWGWAAGVVGALIGGLVFILTAQQALVESDEDRQDQVRRQLKEEGWF